MGNASNITIAPINVLWQIEASEIIDLKGLTGADVKGTSFLTYLPDGSSVYFWGDDGVVIDPASGDRGIPFTVVGDGDTAATLAAALQSAADADADFSAALEGSTGVLLKRAAYGRVAETADVDMGVAIQICQYGQDFDLGLLDGDIELSVAPANFTVQAHQTGVTPLGQLFQGIETLEVTTALLETQNAKLKELYRVFGGVYTPGGGTEMFGAGTSKQGQNLLLEAARLKLRPVNAVDASQDVTLCLALPTPDTLTFSGENPRTLSVTWQGFIDQTLDKNISALAIGDSSQL